MGDTSVSEEGAWGRYLARLTRRPGWTITRLSNESGISRQAISDWINNDSSGTGLKIETVMMIARAAGPGEDPVNALRAAAGLVQPPEDDPELAAEIAAVKALNLRDVYEAEIIKTIKDRRARDQERRMQDLAETTEIFRRAEDQTAP